MFRLSILFLSILAVTYGHVHRCGTPDPSPKKLLDDISILSDYQHQLNSEDPDQEFEPAIITTYVHVNTYDVNSKNGLVVAGLPNITQINQAIDLLNDAYKNASFSFILAKVLVTKNDSWIGYTSSLDPIAKQMKAATRVGDYATLNIWLTKLGSPLLGFATFPGDVSHGEMMIDGVVMDTETLPGGDFAPYNLGATITHEVGHWLNLYHVFQGGCIPPGDLVADTPYQRSETQGCPAKAPQSCLLYNETGVDNIHNFMDYSFDKCLWEFTKGQNKRMQLSWGAYRAGKVVPDPSIADPVSVATFEPEDSASISAPTDYYMRYLIAIPIAGVVATIVGVVTYIISRRKTQTYEKLNTEIPI